jgi:hypothetical protein
MFGKEGPVPEGMSAEAALKNIDYSETHDQIKSNLIFLADQFKVQKGYKPPYWELVNLTRQARDEIVIEILRNVLFRYLLSVTELRLSFLRKEALIKAGAGIIFCIVRLI